MTYFCTSLNRKAAPSQINLIKNAKNNFLLVKKFKNTSSAQLWPPYNTTNRVFSSRQFGIFEILQSFKNFTEIKNGRHLASLSPRRDGHPLHHGPSQVGVCVCVWLGVCGCVNVWVCVCVCVCVNVCLRVRVCVCGCVNVFLYFIGCVCLIGSVCVCAWCLAGCVRVCGCVDVCVCSRVCWGVRPVCVSQLLWVCVCVCVGVWDIAEQDTGIETIGRIHGQFAKTKSLAMRSSSCVYTSLYICWVQSWALAVFFGVKNKK